MPASRGQKLWAQHMGTPREGRGHPGGTEGLGTAGGVGDSRRGLSRFTEISISCTSLNGSGLGRSPGTDPGAKTTATGTASWN